MYIRCTGTQTCCRPGAACLHTTSCTVAAIIRPYRPRPTWSQGHRQEDRWILWTRRLRTGSEEEEGKGHHRHLARSTCTYRTPEDQAGPPTLLQSPSLLTLIPATTADGTLGRSPLRPSGLAAECTVELGGDTLHEVEKTRGRFWSRIMVCYKKAPGQ